MTPKEKAKELMQKAYDLDKFNKTPQSQCKVIALLCVNETFKALVDAYPSKDKPHTFIEYWQKVKEHINEL